MRFSVPHCRPHTLALLLIPVFVIIQRTSCRFTFLLRKSTRLFAELCYENGGDGRIIIKCIEHSSYCCRCLVCIVVVVLCVLLLVVLCVLLLVVLCVLFQLSCVYCCSCLVCIVVSCLVCIVVSCLVCIVSVVLCVLL